MLSACTTYKGTARERVDLSSHKRTDCTPQNLPEGFPRGLGDFRRVVRQAINDLQVNPRRWVIALIRGHGTSIDGRGLSGYGLRARSHLLADVVTRRAAKAAALLSSSLTGRGSATRGLLERSDMPPTAAPEAQEAGRRAPQRGQGSATRLHWTRSGHATEGRTRDPRGCE